MKAKVIKMWPFSIKNNDSITICYIFAVTKANR